VAWNISYFLDRCLLDELPLHLQEAIRDRGLLTSNGNRVSNKVSFCGLITCQGGNYIFLPRKTDRGSEKKVHKKYAPDLFKALRKYHREVSSLLNVNEDGVELEGTDNISAIYSLIDDYRKNGLYSKRQTHRNKNKGKPDWPRTISRHQPVLSNIGPAYIEYEGVQRNNSADGEISRIHAYIIKELDDKFGEIFIGNKSYKHDGILPPQTLEKNYFISRLEHELRNVYSERDVILIRTLINVVNKIFNNQIEETVIGIRGFHTIWEHMLNKVLEGKVDINKEFSFPSYVDNQGAVYPAKLKGQRTDTILADYKKNQFSVIDAKYYDAVSLGTAPGWPDLVKQFFYAKAVESLKPTASVKNYFIFPGNNSHFDHALMSKDDSLATDHRYPPIFCKYIDPAEVIKAYISGANLSQFSQELLS